jgi:hypothetical protein
VSSPHPIEFIPPGGTGRSKNGKTMRRSITLEA